MILSEVTTRAWARAVAKTKDDEDEGSPPRGGANPGEVRREKIERSAEALRGRHAPISFPPNQCSASNALRVTGKTKAREVAITVSSVPVSSVTLLRHLTHDTWHVTLFSEGRLPCVESLDTSARATRRRSY